MKDIRKMDKLLLIIVLVFLAFGVLMIFSATSASAVLKYAVSSGYFAYRQLIAIGAGLFAGLFILFYPTKRYKRLIYLAVIGVIVLLVYVFLKGEITNNALSWIPIFGMRIQPSEFAKSILIVFMAVFYDELYNRNVKSIGLYFIPPVIAGIMFVLIAKQPDYGSAIILALIAMFIFFSVPFVKENKKQVFKICGIALLIIIPFIILLKDRIFTEERLSRLNFSSPCTRYREDTGYQTCNGYIAISNGGLFGLGPGNSTQKYLYLPESHTDFIFPIIVEELGCITGIVIILLYGLILFRLFVIAKGADNLRCSIIAYGTLIYLAAHIVINLWGVLALMPLTGVPLPFLSYGGSFTLNAIVMVFVCERVAIENKKNKLKRQLNNL